MSMMIGIVIRAKFCSNDWFLHLYFLRLCILIFTHTNYTEFVPVAVMFQLSQETHPDSFHNRSQAQSNHSKSVRNGQTAVCRSPQGLVRMSPHPPASPPELSHENPWKIAISRWRVFVSLPCQPWHNVVASRNLLGISQRLPQCGFQWHQVASGGIRWHQRHSLNSLARSWRTPCTTTSLKWIYRKTFIMDMPWKCFDHPWAMSPRIVTLLFMLF